MKPRIVFLHGNQATHWSFAWTPWLKQQLESNGYTTFFETFPDSVIARSTYWLPFLREHVRAGENDVLVGWSSGAVAAMRYAETNNIKGSVLIAPCTSDLEDELEKQSGYFDTPWNWSAIRANQGHIALVHSDNDPYIPQEQFATVLAETGAQDILVPGAKHFIEQDTFPEVLEHILRTYP